ncbi:transposase [sulfur-oxidizing endosymbiont of Gigantopelta aegis]|uniref:transposase n=1 Tax=sulfur-oxidizing endosymbiont of Gigantopelta aegis TaxID=2794934 RepID=UPI002483C94B|nr:transposase [sulfur-oxidizing endosymbiont of Gigantopelta aegis]
MPRPLRVEYENACYHVMNRGRARHDIFHDKKYYQLFLNTLAEAHKRFGIQIQSYCLMRNHYHLLIKTPEGNLGRAMRHVNGLYTQRYNRMRTTDGPLFRGRYKAILVEEDSYQLQLSRYIHRNPLEAGIDVELELYPWSSYAYYLGKEVAPEWLYPQEILAQLNTLHNVFEKYQAYVAQGVDEELKEFYSKGNIVPFLGSESFREWAYQQRQTDEQELTKEIQKIFRPSIESIIIKTSEHFKVSKQSITQSQRGRVKNNIPRWVAMYLAQEIATAKLKEIAEKFGLKSVGSIPTTIKKLKCLLDKDKVLLNIIEEINDEYDS